MVIPLDENLRNHCAAASSRPRLLLRLETAAGTLWFADAPGTTGPAEVPVEGAWLVEVETLRQQMDRWGGERRGEVECRLADPDGILRDLLRRDAFDGARACLFLAFADAPVSRLPLFENAIADGAEWREDGACLALRLRDAVAVFRDRPWVRTAERTVFPRLPAENGGRALPVVFGTPRRVPAVRVGGGARAVLAKGVDANAVEILVDDASAFPAGPLRLRVGDEEMDGAFAGNTFTATARGLVLAEAAVADDMGDPAVLRLMGLPDDVADQAFAGRFLAVDVSTPSGNRPRIVSFVAETGAVHLDEPLVDTLNRPLLLTAGTAIRVETPAEAHPVGTPVYEVGPEWVYLACDHPASAIDEIEGRGVVQESVRSYGLAVWNARRDFRPFPPGFVRAVPADDTLFPALGRPVALLRLPLPPTALGMDSDELWVGLRAPPREAAGGTAGYPAVAVENCCNPAETLRALLLRAGLSPDRLDENAFRLAAADRADEQVAIVLDSTRAAGELLGEFCFQSRLALVWREGRLAAVARERLENAAPVAALTPDTLAADGVVLGLVPEDGLATECVARYRRRGRVEAVALSDPDAVARLGRRPLDLDCWIYDRRRFVERMAAWHLRRRRHRWHTLRVRTHLAGVALETGDVVGVTHGALPAGGARGTVAALERRPPAPGLGRLGGATAALVLRTAPGCASSCETACETSACETAGCELVCESACEQVCENQCESACETACELSCTAQCETVCQVYCQFARTVGQPCQTSAEGPCATACESTCELACQSCCEISCESTHREKPRLVRRMRVAVPPSYFGDHVGAAEEGVADDCPSFLLRDPCDLRPAAGEPALAYLDALEQWTLAATGRDAKLVKIVAAVGDAFQVVETAPDGSTWGAPFLAYPVPED